MGQAGILQVLNLLTSLDIEDLGGPVAACSDETTVATEADAADNALMCQVVHKLNVKHSAHTRVEDGIPVITFPLQMRRKTVDGKVDKLVSAVAEFVNILLVLGHAQRLLLLSQSRRRRGAWHGGRARIRVHAVLLWRSWAARGPSCVCTRLTRTG